MPSERGFGSTEVLYIDPKSCVDCGACVEVCPVDAIAHQSSLETHETPYRELNRVYFGSREFERRERALPAPRLVVADREPLRVAVVGAGPTAMFAVETLLARRDLAPEVTVYARLPYLSGSFGSESLPITRAPSGSSPDSSEQRRSAA